jgi:hypothetical protein
MATSGTHSFAMDIKDILEEAYERIGKECRSGYDYRTGRRSLDLLMLEWQNKGLNLWTVKSASQTLTAGTAAYTLDPERVDVIEGLLRTDAGNATQQTDLHMKRISVSHWARQTNKLTTGRPIQYWVERHLFLLLLGADRGQWHTRQQYGRCSGPVFTATDIWIGILSGPKNTGCSGPADHSQAGL